jgi:drug/metabolite transporter (DMT)-like permease
MAVIPKPSVWQLSLVLTVALFCVSTAAIFIRLALAASPTTGVGFSLFLAASRLVLASLVLIPAWWKFRHNPFQTSALFYSVAAGVCLALHFASWITSLSYTSIAASTTLVTTNPIWVALLSWLWFREKPGSMTLSGIALALIGSLWIGLEGAPSLPGQHPLLGNMLALVGSWAVSLYFILGREAQRRGLSIGSHVVLTYSTAALVLLPAPLLLQTSYWGYPQAVYLNVLWMALFPQVIGHTGLTWAVRWVSPTLVTLTILTEPIGSSILAFLIFRENPGWAVALGAGIILSGVAIAALGARQSTLEP